MWRRVRLLNVLRFEESVVVVLVDEERERRAVGIGIGAITCGGRESAARW